MAVFLGWIPDNHTSYGSKFRSEADAYCLILAAIAVGS